MMKKSKKEAPPPSEELAQEWDLSEGLGILPSDVNLTQNIGCVGNSAKKSKNETLKKEK